MSISSKDAWHEAEGFLADTLAMLEDEGDEAELVDRLRRVRSKLSSAVRGFETDAVTAVRGSLTAR